MELQDLLSSPTPKVLKKLKIKVWGFVIVKKIREELKTEKIVVKVRNQITGLQNMIYALAGATGQVQKSQYSPGIVLYNAGGQVIKSLTLANVGQTPTNVGATAIFQVIDSSTDTYTTVQMMLVSEVGGLNVNVATANLTVTKSANEYLYINWIINFCVTSNPGNLLIIPSFTLGINANSCTNNCCNPYVCSNGEIADITSQFPSCVQYTGENYINQNFMTPVIFYLLTYSNSSIKYIYPGNNALAVAVPSGGYWQTPNGCPSASSITGMSVITTIGTTSYISFIFATCPTSSNPNKSSSQIAWCGSPTYSVPQIIANILFNSQSATLNYVGILIEFTT